MAKIAVAPLVGAWIEIFGCSVTVCGCTGSLPSWERGLKSCTDLSVAGKQASLPSWERGLKLTTAMSAQAQQIVAPLVGAWIEITDLRYELLAW